MVLLLTKKKFDSIKKFLFLIIQHSEENNSDFNIDEYLSHINLSTLNTEETKLCDLEISENECWLTLNKMSFI